MNSSKVSIQSLLDQKNLFKSQLPRDANIQVVTEQETVKYVISRGNIEKNKKYLAQMLERETSFPATALDNSRALHGACLGAGSIGGSTFLNLVRFGVSSEAGLTVIDPEVHDTSNLPRQATDLVLLEDYNTNKAVSTLISGLRINPYMHAIAYPHAVTEDNIKSLLEGKDFAVMGIDASRPDLLALLITLCDEMELPLFGGLDISTTRVTHTMLPNRNSLIREAINQEKIQALKDGKLHPLTWLSGMTRIEHIPYQFLKDLSNVLSGKISFIPQSRIASETQGIHTTANIINYFSDNSHKVPSFAMIDMINGIFTPDTEAFEIEKAKKIAFAKSTNELEQQVLSILGTNSEEYISLVNSPRATTIW